MSTENLSKKSRAYRLLHPIMIPFCDVSKVIHNGYHLPSVAEALQGWQTMLALFCCLPMRQDLQRPYKDARLHRLPS